MKFLISKKIIDNRVLHLSITWMMALFIVALGLSLSVKAIDFGLSPMAWINTVLGNEAEFIDPMLLSDLLLSLHTDLFGLILVYVLVGAVMVRTSRSQISKTLRLLGALSALLLYPLGLIASVWIGEIGVVVSWAGFVAFHFALLGCTLDMLILLLRKKL